MNINRTCEECNNDTIEIGIFPWSKTLVNCKNCGASFRLKDYLIWPILLLIELCIPFGFLILLFYSVIYWYWAIPLTVLSVFIIEYLKRRYASLKLVGIRAKLKEKGVKLDPIKLAAAKKKL